MANVRVGCIAAVVTSLANMIVNGVLASFGGWMLMLAVAVAHDHWLTGLPTLGYLWAWLIVWLLQGAFTSVDLGRDK